MTQLAPIVLKDMANADVTFTPRDIAGGVATLVNSAGVPIGEKKVSLSVSQTASGRRKINIKLVIPEVQDVTVGGVSKPTVVRTAYLDTSITFEGTSNTDERTDALAHLKSLLAETTLIGPAIVALSAPY